MDFLVSDYQTDHVSIADTVVLEDCILHKDRKTTAGSRIMAGFTAPLDATVVTRLANRGTKILGKAAMDEFGVGRVFVDGEESLSGAVAAVAADYTEAALCNDFSGKIRRQAPSNGVCYIHPTYGTVSRYGLIPMISSMDQIGVACKDVVRGFEMLSAIAGKDAGDGAMFPEESYSYQSTGKPVVGIPVNVMAKTPEKEQKPVLDFASRFRTKNVELSYFEVYSQVMYILGCAEISNNINRYDGIKMGYRTEDYRTLNELYLKTRTEGFGLDVKLAAVMGSMVLSKDSYEPLYEKAMRIRRLIKESLTFDGYDLIALPAWPDAEPYEQIALYALATLAGLPSLSVPYQGGTVQLVANVKNEGALLAAWQEVTP